MPGKPTEVVTQKKKGILKPVSDSKVLSKLVRQCIVPNVSRKRKTLTKVVTLEVNSSLEVISDSKVITEPVRQSSVANVSRKRKWILVTPEEDSGVSDGTVVTPKKRAIVKVAKPVSALAVPKAVDRQTDVEDETSGKAAVVAKKIRKPTLVPTAVIPSTSQPQSSDYDDDSQIDAEENAYRQQLAQTQIAAYKKSGKGKGKGKVKKDLPEGVTIYCTKCHEVFGNADDLSVHEKKCYIGRRYPCPYAGCTHVNSQNSLLDEHIKGVHENNPFRCELCPNEVFIYKKSYNKHFKRYHQSGAENRHKFKYTCEYCDFVSDDRTEYQTHIDRHRNRKRYKCNVCESAYFTQSQLTNHFKNSCSSVVEDNKYECSVCGKQLKSEDRYREHFYSQHVLDQPQKMYYCEVCICRFFSERGLQLHVCKSGSKK